MVSISMDVRGVERLQRELETAPARYDRAFAAAMNDLSPRILTRIRAMLPSDTGKMKRDTRITRIKDGIAIHIPIYFRGQLSGRLRNLTLGKLVSDGELMEAMRAHL